MKKPIYAYIDEECYKFIREYAKQYIEMGYKNWLGKALEDAIKALRDNKSLVQRHARTNNKKWSTSNSVNFSNTRTFGRINRIINRLNGKKAIIFADLIRIIVDEAGSDYRTISRYLKLLQDLYGMRFHKNNNCIVYFENDPEIPLVKLDINIKKLRYLMTVCMK